jgi:hypothetical protein
MSRLALLLICVCLLSGARVAAAPAEPFGEAAPPLTATFETATKGRDKHVASAREKWTLAREAGRVAYTFGQATERRLDVWLRTAAETRLLRVFPQERTTVVQWLEAEQLPAQLTSKNARMERSITLHKLVVGHAELASETETKRYRRIDAADLGDLEHDPFVKRYGSLLQSPHHHP